MSSNKLHKRLEIRLRRSGWSAVTAAVMLGTKFILEFVRYSENILLYFQIYLTISLMIQTSCYSATLSLFGLLCHQTTALKLHQTQAISPSLASLLRRGTFIYP